jgi:hypothetical protein
MTMLFITLEERFWRGKRMIVLEEYEKGWEWRYTPPPKRHT